MAVKKEKNKNKAKRESLFIFIVLLFVMGVLAYTAYNLKIKNESVIITSNSSLSEIELFCDDLEKKLKLEETWGTKDWNCEVAYDEGLPSSDIIYNKTRGLCNCTAVFPNGESKSVEVRQSK